MKSTFSGYIRPTTAEFSELWKSALIVLDANVLLNIYCYSASTREHLLSLLEKVSQRLWIPHQFALEYVRNRPGIILKQAKNCQKVRKSLRTMIEQDFRAKNTQPFFSDEILRKIEDLCDQLTEAQNAHENMIGTDPHLERILKLFDGRVGTPTDEKRMDELHEQARERYLKKTPPGYADQKDKPEPDCFGDFIAWRQILDHAKNNRTSVILVTDDAKDDWWQIYDDRTLGPRPELVTEFVAECDTQFYMYSTATFTKHAPEYVDLAVEAAVIDELVRTRVAQLSEKTPEKSVPKVPTTVKASPIEPKKSTEIDDVKELKEDVKDTPAEGGE